MKLDFVKLFNRYNFYYISKNNKIHFLYSSNSLINSKKRILKTLKQKKKKSGKIVITSLNLVSKKKYMLNKKSKIKIIGGPVYIRIQEYNIKLTKMKKIYLKKGNSNKVYFPKKYIIKKYNSKNKWIIRDTNKVVKKFINNKLKTSLIAINLINKL